jgi:hypothetical protein
VLTEENKNDPLNHTKQHQGILLVRLGFRVVSCDLEIVLSSSDTKGHQRKSACYARSHWEKLFVLAYRAGEGARGPSKNEHINSVGCGFALNHAKYRTSSLKQNDPYDGRFHQLSSESDKHCALVHAGHSMPGTDRRGWLFWSTDSHDIDSNELECFCEIVAQEPCWGTTVNDQERDF